MLIAAFLFAGILYYVYGEGKDNGASAVIERQNEIDREVIRGSRGARDNVDRCYTRGGVWQRETGTCSK
jgi:hypothetical protein